MPQPLQLIIDLLPRLSSEDVVKLQGLLKIRQGKCVKDEEQVGIVQHSVQSFLLYAAIQKQFKEILKAKLPPLKVLQKRDRQLIEKVCKYLINYFEEIILDTNTPKENKRTILAAFFSLYVTVTINAISRNTQKIPLTMRTLLIWHVRFPGLLENAYPGYLHDGQLVNMVLLREKPAKIEKK